MEKYEIHIDLTNNDDYERNVAGYLAGVLISLAAKIDATQRLEGIVQDLDGKDIGSFFPK